MSVKIYNINCAASVFEESYTDVGGYPNYSYNEKDINQEDLLNFLNKLKDDINQIYGGGETLISDIDFSDYGADRFCFVLNTDIFGYEITHKYLINQLVLMYIVLNKLNFSQKDIQKLTDSYFKDLKFHYPDDEEDDEYLEYHGWNKNITVEILKKLNSLADYPEEFSDLIFPSFVKA